MSNPTGQAIGGSGVPLWSILAGGAAYSLDGGVTWTLLPGGTVHTGSTLTGDGSSGNPLAVNNILGRAQSLIPAAGFDTVLGTDFDNDQWYTKNIGGLTATIGPSTTAKGGVVALATGTNTSSSALIYPHGSPSYIDNAQTSPWYVYFRFQIGAIDANALCRVEMAGISGGAPTFPIFAVGGTGTLSVTNVTYLVTDGSGTTITSGLGPSLDNNWHTVEMFTDGTTGTIMFDGVSIKTTPATNFGAVPMMPVVVCTNGATGTNRTVNADKLWFVCKGN